MLDSSRLPNLRTAQNLSMNLANEKQHYISKVLLRRFKSSNKPLQCYQLASQTWEEKGIDRLCAAAGYNQLLVPGEETNNALEASISRVESLLPNTFKALEVAAHEGMPTKLLPEIYRNLWSYCSFLKLSSLFSKASAVVSFLTQLNMELERGHYDLWSELRVPGEIIEGFRQEYRAGGRVIIQAQNVLQLIYRLQFERLLNVNYLEFSNADWSICLSPIDLPMSDIGIIQVQLKDLNVNHYLLPIGPRFLLEGVFHHDLSKNSVKTTIRGFEMTMEEAEYRVDCICLSSVREVICADKNFDIGRSLERAGSNGLEFAKIVNPNLVAAAGVLNVSRHYSFKCVSVDDYRRFVHSFILPN